MRARFRGDPERNGSGPEVIEAFGLVFRKGEWTAVTTSDPVQLRKLRGNSHFEVDEAGSVPVSDAAPTVTVDQIPADWQGAHHKKRMAWARAITGEKPATLAEADAAISAFMNPPKPVAANPAPSVAKDDDDWGDLDP